jgi:hypothetical protein
MPATRTPKNKNPHPLQHSSGFSPAPGCALTYHVAAIPILRHVQSFAATARLITAALIYSERFLLPSTNTFIAWKLSGLFPS